MNCGTCEKTCPICTTIVQFLVFGKRFSYRLHKIYCFPNASFPKVIAYGSREATIRQDGEIFAAIGIQSDFRN